MKFLAGIDPRLKAGLLLVCVLLAAGFVLGGVGGAGETRQAYRGLDTLVPGDAARTLARSTDALAAVIDPPAPQIPASEATPEETAAEIAAREAERDVIRRLRKDLTAVETSQGRTQVFIVDREGVEGARRPLKVGQEFADGWQVTGIDETTVTLSNGEETRRLEIYALNDS